MKTGLSLLTAAVLVALLGLGGCPADEPADDDTTGDDDVTGDDDATGDDDTTGDDDDATGDDDDATGDDDDATGDDDDATGDDDDTTACTDADGDGVCVEHGDCDDGDAAVFPGNTETTCNGVDDDCDAATLDEPDGDGDGATICDDCNDADSAVYPGNAETTCNGVDDDCDAATLDEPDADGDGSTVCEDCDDADANVGPDEVEVCGNGIDDDCDAATVDLFDADGDGTDCSVDCDDTDANLNASDADGDGQSSCDGDCDDADGAVDALDVDGDGQTSCDGDCDDTDPGANRLDADGDGFDSCDEGDCDDGDAGAHPGGIETCNGIDDDCDGNLDEGFDGDGDSHTTCGPDGALGTADDDCDDNDASSYPNAPELCDGLDNNCNGVVAADELDDDGDGQMGCEGDCDDTDDTVYDGAEELCDGVDNSCDGIVDGHCRFDLALADATLTGLGGIGDWISYAFDANGDVNGDGYDDILIGSHDNDEAATDAGAAHLVLSPISGTLDIANADAKLLGHTAGDEAGYSVSFAGDVDADGYDDILVGAPYRYVNGTGATAGSAYLQYGPVTGTIDLGYADVVFMPEGRDAVGWSVSDAGDVNADGYGDVLIGACNYSSAGLVSNGAAYLVHGPVSNSMDLVLADAKMTGTQTHDYAGSSVSSAGDVNADGYDDILVGAYYASIGGYNPGAAYLVLGPASGDLPLAAADAVFEGEEDADYAGDRVSGAGDVNGDGYDDILVGARLNANADGDPSAGAAYLVLGPMSGTLDLANADMKIEGEWGDTLGYSVAGGGDFDGDGFDDVAVGSPGAGYTGEAYFLHGPTTGLLSYIDADATYTGVTGEQVGHCVSFAGDTNADGYTDLLVSGSLVGTGGTIYLILGGP